MQSLSNQANCRLWARGISRDIGIRLHNHKLLTITHNKREKELSKLIINNLLEIELDDCSRVVSIEHQRRRETSFTLSEHIADFVVPSLHRLVEPEVLFSKVRKVLLHRLEFRFQVLGVGDAIAPGADSRVWPTPEEVKSAEFRRK
jgi:hypothetical protein